MEPKAEGEANGENGVADGTENGDVAAPVVKKAVKRSPKKSDGMKQTKINFKKRDFSDSEASMDSDDGMFEAAPKAAAVPERQSNRRAVSAKIKYNFSDDDSDNKVRKSFPLRKSFPRELPSCEAISFAR